jgi:NAD(P)H-dependent flavin oxidoreductase YrpB (nitropropane dioxygenase family)
MTSIALPGIIQGGMGIAVSDWRLANAVARLGHLGVVSGTCIDAVLVRRLQDGDVGGHMRRAMEHFPIPRVAAEVLERYFKPHGRATGEPYALLPMHQQVVSAARHQLGVLAAFVEVHLARHGHDGPVGINLLTKIALPNPAFLYGAILAGVDVVLMGAGIPREIPGVLDRLARHEPVETRLEVEGEPAGSAAETSGLAPLALWDGATPPPVRRPAFLPIVSSHALATLFARKYPGGVAGFVIEGPTAGGHNAPPRGEPVLDASGQPVYGERDAVDLDAVRALGLPFWLAGGAGRRGGLHAARARGAAGIQVGTLFAYCDESGLDEGLKRSVLDSAVRGQVEVFTDPLASPTGYPFKVVRWDRDPSAGQPRERICDLGYLRTAYRMPNGRVGFRCASEPVKDYVLKGGTEADTEGRRCLCNALLANIGMAQPREDGGLEPPLLTSGDDLHEIGGFLQGRTRYGAADVVTWLEDRTA